MKCFICGEDLPEDRFDICDNCMLGIVELEERNSGANEFEELFQ